MRRTDESGRRVMALDVAHRANAGHAGARLRIVHQPAPATNDRQARLEASPTRRAITMAGKSTPNVERKVAIIRADVFTA